VELKDMAGKHPDLTGAVVVGHIRNITGHWMLLERPETAKRQARKPRTNAKSATAAGGSATAFPGGGVTSGA
jgi:hypothetical protein